jgi:HSP20 family protein
LQKIAVTGYTKEAQNKVHLIMTKEKKSFFERLTGAQNVQPSGSAMPHMSAGSLPVFTDEVETTVTMHEAPIFHEPAAPSWSTPTAPSFASEAVSDDDAEGQLTIDVYQTENDIVIKSTIAGVKPEDLDVSINNDMVTIKGERSNEEQVDGGNYYYQECYWGSFSRSVLLPVDVIPEKADASLKNGILTIRLPKADTTKTKKIQVRGF